MRELDDLDRRYGLGALPGTTSPLTGPFAPPPPPQHRRRRRVGGGSGLLPGLLLTVLVVTGLVTLAPGADFDAARRLVGLGPDRITAAPTIPGGEGQFAFLQEQPDGSPVGWDPCRPIRYEVNLDGAPEDAEEMVATAVERTSEATGLSFELVGETDERDYFQRQDGLMGDPPPVLVGWGTAAEFEDLAGDVAGLGGAVAVGPRGQRAFYRTGSVLLDAEAFEEIDERTRGGDRARALQQAVVDHEFGHLVGLAHVEDPRELMHGEGVGTVDYGPGDLQGLARVGGVPCR